MLYPLACPPTETICKFK
ncbi:unnamed protein product, partial [Allacma fusca]